MINGGILLKYEKAMIFVELCGGLGNQLFEYAFGRYIQYKSGQDLCLYTGRLDRDKVGIKRLYSLGNYKLNKHVSVVNNMLPWFANDFDNYFIKVFRKLFPKIALNVLAHNNVYMWKETDYYRLPNVNFNKDIFICGYWQCERYFYEIKSILQKEIVLQKEFSEKNKQIIQQMNLTDSVCMHVRRGDFVNSIHYVCDIKYYKEALKLISKEKTKFQLFVFSDDILWVKSNIDVPANTVYVDWKNSNYEELLLMSNCKNFIISNSSFSWWAQYLSSNNEKIVVSPSKWYNNNCKVDIYQPNWRIIEV